MIVTYPTEAVRERQTVPVGSTRADEFAMPNSFVVSMVSEMHLP
jgi:hypothetical protein